MSASLLFISIFLLQIKHVPLAEVGAIYLISGAMDIIGQVVGGRLSDRFGTKTMAITGLTSSVFFFSLIAFFVLNAGPVIVYFILYPLLSFTTDISQVPISSYVADRQKDLMNSGLALIYVGLNLGFTLGPVSGGILIQYVGYYSLFLFGAVTAAAAELIIIIGIKANPKYALRRKEEKRVSNRIERGVYPFLGLVLASFAVIAFQGAPLSVYESAFLSLNTTEIGLVMTTNGLIITLFQIPISRKISIHKSMKLYPITIGCLITAFGFLIIARAHGLMLLEIAITLTTLGETMVVVPANVVVTMFSKDYNRGKYQGYYNASTRAGSSLASYLGPLMFALLFSSAANAWYIVAAVSALTGLGYLLYSGPLARHYGKLGSSTG